MSRPWYLDLHLERAVFELKSKILGLTRFLIKMRNRIFSSLKKTMIIEKKVIEHSLITKFILQLFAFIQIW